MKIIILGSGIIGTTTAYMLSKMGCEVTVLEKNKSSGMGCSYANGGQLSFSHAQPWSCSSSISSIIKSAFKPKSGVYVKDFANKEFLKWFFKFALNSTNKKTKEISTKLLKFGNYSRTILEEILKDEEINFEYSKKGILHFYRSKKVFNDAIKQANFQKEQGCNLSILNADKCIKVEPNLKKLLENKKLAGGILFKDDASGDSFIFANKLANICKKKYGVEFIYNCEVKNILTNYKKITGVNTSQGIFQADLYINTLGSYGNKLLKGLNIKTNIYPIKGYSISAPINNNFSAPSMTLTDVENKIVYSNLGSTFRAAGTIEICDFDENKNSKNLKFLENTIKSTYQNFGDLQNSIKWYGFRPYRPNCLPLIGKVEKYGNLFINSGHGSLGWSNSFASAKIISDIILNKNCDKQFNFFEEEISFC